MPERPLSEMILVSGLVPDHLFLVLVGQGGHVTGNGGLLANRRRRDDLFLTQHGLYEIPEVVDGAVALLVFLRAVDMDVGTRLDALGSAVGGIGAARIVLFGLEVEVLAVHHADGS